jgi:error-prone DNA polymerase
LQLIPLAAGDVHMDVRRQRVLQDTMTAIRHGMTLADCGEHLFRNGERHLRTRRALGNIHPPPLLDNAVQLARRCSFDLKRDLEYHYPAELVPARPHAHQLAARTARSKACASAGRKACRRRSSRRSMTNSR